MSNWENDCKFTGVDSAELKIVIITKKLVGEGTEQSPVRLLTQIWDINGKLLASSEPLTPQGAVDPAFRCRFE